MQPYQNLHIQGYHSYIMKISLWPKWQDKCSVQKHFDRINILSVRGVPQLLHSTLIYYWTGNSEMQIMVWWLNTNLSLSPHTQEIYCNQGTYNLNIKCSFIQWIRKKLCHSYDLSYIISLGGSQVLLLPGPQAYTSEFGYSMVSSTWCVYKNHRITLLC